MAMIDHTVMVFKNGKLMTNLYKDIGDCLSEWLLPFEYGRDGDIYEVNGVNISEQITWHKEDYNAVYVRSGSPKIYNKRNIYQWIDWLKWKLHIMEYCYHTEVVGELKNDKALLYLYNNHVGNTWVSFYFDRETGDSYVVLGGYGHHCNVYTHFYERGYGDKFERKMALEAYRWCMDDVLQTIMESICESYFDKDNELKMVQSMFGYKSYWDMSEEEREMYRAQEEIEVIE